MDERNRVTVHILGTEYTISGEASREHMMHVADYVDTEMHKLMSKLPSRGKADIAVLTAINAADEYFNLLKNTEQIRSDNEQLKHDVVHFNQLWEDAKRNFIAYKEENQSASSERMTLQRELVEKNATVSDLRGRIAGLQEQLNQLNEKNQTLLLRLSEQKETHSTSSDALRAMEEKCKELENNYFDLQMENIRLKGEMERLRNTEDQ